MPWRSAPLDGPEGPGAETHVLSPRQGSHGSHRDFQDAPAGGRADSEAYRKTSRRMHELVEQIPGFISIKAYTAEDGEEIDLVRFANEEALRTWKEQPDHLEAQRRGRDEFYDRYSVQACKVVRDYEFRVDALDPSHEADHNRGKPQGLSAQ